MAAQEWKPVRKTVTLGTVERGQVQLEMDTWEVAPGILLLPWLVWGKARTIEGAELPEFAHGDRSQGWMLHHEASCMAMALLRNQKQRFLKPTFVRKFLKPLLDALPANAGSMTGEELAKVPGLRDLKRSLVARWK